MASSINNTAWMEWMEKLMGGVSRQAYAATLPPDRFYCLLDDLPLQLIPDRSRTLLETRKDQQLFLNPECFLSYGNQSPDGVLATKEVLSSFALRGTIAWVPDAFTGDWLPFWLGPEIEEIMRNLKPAKSMPETLSHAVLALLLGAGIIAPGDDAERRSRWNMRLTKASALFRTRGYAPISDLIHPFHIAALRRYYRYLIRTGAIRLGDGQSPLRYVAYNDPVARFFHQHIAKTVSVVAGEPVKPSYVYLASYLSGAELKKHTDRPQCEFSVTLCLDFSPEPVLGTPWPIELDTPGGSVKVYQALGDGLAYRGMRLPHYRGILGEGQTSTSIFFHYVPEDFTGSLN
jgi:hypothetical protein